MKIVGFQKNSFVDYPSKIAAVIFLAGCDFDCWYCHNKAVCQDKTGITYPQSMILDFLKKRKGFLDGIVISGGEPLFNNNLISFISKVKEQGFLVKLDTNGFNFKALKELVQSGLIDYVAMDLKAPFEKYSEIIRKDIDLETIKNSIDFLKHAKIEYEFRTTVVPEFSLEDIRSMAVILDGAKRYALQQYRSVGDEKKKVLGLPHNSDFFKRAKSVVQDHVRDVILRGM